MLTSTENYPNRELGFAEYSFFTLQKARYFLCCLILLISTMVAWGQNSKEQEKEEEKKNRQVIHYFFDSTFTEERDSITRQIDRNALKNTEQFYDTLRKKAYQYKWIGKLHDYLFINNERSNQLRKREIDNISNPFEEYRGRKIQEITIHQLDVFGPTLSDTTDETEEWYKELGNFIHFPTRKSIIWENLLFTVNDTLDPSLLVDNERVLRGLQFIKDARIIVDEDPAYPDRVSLTILTQDIWSKGFSVDMNSINAGQIELYDNNIFGIGHKFQNNILFDYLENGNPGIESFYRISNFKGSFVNSRFYYLNSFHTNRYGMELNRDFFSYKTRIVGGYAFYHTKTRENIRKTDTVLPNVFLNYNENDLWAGYAFPLATESKIFRKRTRLILAARYNNMRFFEGPEVEERYNYRYHNHHLVLGSISLSRQNFYRSALIYGFGKTEDIPVGDLVTYTFGWEADEFYRRFYSGLNLKHGQFFEHFGYLSNSIGLGGFFYEDDFEQGVLDLRVKYISHLFEFKNYKMRQFVDLNYTRGIKRFPGEQLYFDNSYDIRGFNDLSLFGKKKLVVRSETVAFTNLYYYGFRFAFYGFLDFGFIGSKNKFVLNNPLQTGFGFGMRIRNENLVFKTFQIRLGFYPSLNNGDNFLLRISGEKALVPHRYTPEAPQKIEF